MISSTKGIVISSLKYGETSLIVRVFTSTFGLRSYIVNSVRKSKPKFAASLFQPLSLLEMVVYEKGKEGLNRVKEIKSDYIFQEIPFSLSKSTLCLFLSEVMHYSIKEESASPDLFQYLFHAIQYLDQLDHSISQFHLAFLASLSHYLGFKPVLDGDSTYPYFDLKEGIFLKQDPEHHLVVEGEDSELLCNVFAAGLEKLDLLLIPRFKRQKLLKHLLKYYEVHIPNFREIKSLGVLEMMMQDLKEGK